MQYVMLYFSMREITITTVLQSVYSQLLLIFTTIVEFTIFSNGFNCFY